MSGYREWLHKEFESRTRRKPAYSLRAFARDLGIPPPKLSETLRGICGISSKRAEQIARKLRFSPEEKKLFITLVESEHSRSKTGKANAQERLQSLKKTQSFSEISLEKFRILSDWQHFAILELTDTMGFQSNPAWIAKRLGLSVEKTKQSLSRLEKFGLLVKNKSGVYSQTLIDLATPTDIPNKSIKDFHSQMLQQAGIAMEEVPVDERDFSSITMAIDTKDLPLAKEYLREFRRKFCKDLQANETKDRVYSLNIQFFPLDRTEKGTPHDPQKH